MKSLLLPLRVAVSLWIVGFSIAFAHQHKNVNVELRAKWSGTPLALEIGELLAKERGDYLWRFIDAWLDKEPEFVSHNPRECIKEILSLGKSFVDGQLASVLELSLSVRSTSPKLVLYRQLAQESLSSSTSKPHCCWIDAGSKLLFEESEVLAWLDSASESSPELLEFDHIYPQGGSSTRAAILYGALGTPCFKAFHNILSEASKKGLVRYVFRPVLQAGCEKSCSTCGKVGAGERMKLSGYGVELALKNMEYKAIDDSELKSGGESDELSSEDLSQEVGGFIFSKLLERKPHLEAELMTFRDQLLSSDISDNMNVWEVKDLGYQAAQRIVSAAEPLRLMQEINQNFPILVSSLSRIKINESIKEEILSNQQMVQPGKTLLAINGALVSNAENLDLFTLIHMIHEELSFADKIAKLKVPADSVNKLLRLAEPAEQSSPRLDFRSDEFVHYLNNLEEDPKYRTWRSNINELLMPLYPGQLYYIRKNLFHLVYVIDPASVKGLKLVELIMHYYHNNVPFRFGLILVSPEQMKSFERNDDAKDNEGLSNLVIRLFLYIKESQGVQHAFEFLHNILDDTEDDTVEESLVQEAFVESLRSMQKTSSMEIFSKLKTGEDYKKEALSSSYFAYKLGLSNMSPSLLMNGLVYGPSQVQSAALVAMKEELHRLQEGVYFGHINSRTDVLDKFLSEEGFKRYNPKIAGKDSKYVSLAVPFIEGNPVIKNLQYLHSSRTEDDVKPVTHWLIVDLTQSSGIRLLKQAIDYLVEGSEKARIGVLNNIDGNLASPTRSAEFLFTRIVAHVMQSSSRRSKHLLFFKSFAAGFNPKHSFEEALEFFVKIAEEAGLNSAQLKEELLKESTIDSQASQFSEERKFVLDLFSIKPGSSAVITNGRVFIQDETPFILEDFQMLETMEYRRRIKDVQQIIEDVKWEGLEADDITSEFLSSVMMVVSSTMASRSRSPETAHFELLKADQSAIVRNNKDSPLQIDAVINPLSAVAQKLTPLLLMLDEWLRPNIRLVLNPLNSLADLPLKNFYRYVLPPKDDFLSDGAGPSGWFSNMPPSRTLTMNLDVPEPWLVESVIAIHDLDNIVLEKLEKERTLHAVFELEALMVTGHCYEHSEPPRGLQLILGTKQEPHIVDTIVMANLGYFQLKAAPGVWILRLAEGRSSELYTLRGSREGTSEGPVSRQVVVADMRGELVRLDVVKRIGKEDEKLLDADNQKKRIDKSKGFFEWAAGFIGSGQKRASSSNDTTSARQGEPINIFSVASGHLYERFLKIMMLSVLKNTNRPVKFWFIKNYLSPQFKDLIPHMAQEYDFGYELVTYKWPTWLHKQTEKQRIIWAYKILFLDVIFPLSLRKVIFVDADQIVRTDMGELYDMDIKGKPLAYTPFCDNNKEMDGYRFWSQGFWKEHLQGKPYHISALYVVDLDKFRQTAAGDNLRVFYESLSKDPNSLSNLDQDLPNYAQHTVPIFSLPQEWLWCESWCGNATKARAKTIDLCNNPMTKEPKLQGAKRIVSEWPALDEEAREFTKRILGIEHGTAVQASPPTGESVQAPAPVDHIPRSDAGKDEL